MSLNCLYYPSASNLPLTEEEKKEVLRKFRFRPSAVSPATSEGINALPATPPQIDQGYVSTFSLEGNNNSKPGSTSTPFFTPSNCGGHQDHPGHQVATQIRVPPPPDFRSPKKLSSIPMVRKSITIQKRKRMAPPTSKKTKIPSLLKKVTFQELSDTCEISEIPASISGLSNIRESIVGESPPRNKWLKQGACASTPKNPKLFIQTTGTARSKWVVTSVKPFLMKRKSQVFDSTASSSTSLKYASKSTSKF